MKTRIQQMMVGFVFFILAVFMLTSTPVLAEDVFGWKNVGSAGFSEGEAKGTNIAIDNSGTLYVAYVNFYNYCLRPTVMKYDGNSWTAVGSFPERASGFVMAIDSSGTPYVAYGDGGNDYKAVVKKYDGQNWVDVGNPGISAGNAYSIDIAIDRNGTPYVIYTDGANDDKAVVKKYDGNTWVDLGSVSTGKAKYINIAIDSSGTLYVVYRDEGGKTYHAIAKKYEGGSWVDLGSVNSGAANGIDIAIDSSGIPYVVYIEYNAYSQRVYVKKYVEGTWTAVGGRLGYDSISPNIVIDSNGIPYIVWDWNTKEVCVQKYEGGSWVDLGIASSSRASSPGIVLDSSGNPYVVYKDASNDDKATVRTYSLLSSACEITSVSSPAEANLVDNDITAIVASTMSELTVDVAVSAGAAWKLYRDSECLVEIADKTMNLNYGNNTAYIKVTAEDGTTKTYTLLVIKANSYTITIADPVGGTATATVDQETALAGEIITVNITNIQAETQISSVSVNDGAVQVTKVLGEPKYTFVMPEEDVTVRVILEPMKYTVDFNSNGGSTVTSQAIDYNELVSEPTAPTKEGYTFIGWFKDSELTTSWTFASDRVPASDIILYAKWDVRTDTAYKVEHYQQNIVGDEYTLFETEELTGTTDTEVTASAKTYTGFTENTSSAERIASGNIEGDGNLVLKLYYDRDEYTVTFKDHDGTVKKTDTIRYEGAATAPTDPTKEGYTFTGWDVDYSNVTSDLTITAQYSINQYTITFDTAGGSNVASITQDYGTSIIAPEDPVKEGYTFNGWYQEAALTTPWTFSSDQVLVSDITLYAKWDVRTDTAYKVEYYQQNIVGDEYTLFETEELTGTTDTEVTASAKTYTGFIENTSTAARVASGNISGDGSLVLKLYYDRNEYTVSFKDHDGTDIDTETVRYEGIATAPSDPTRSGYTFRGWYEDEALTKAFDFDTPIVEDKTLYARWSRISRGSKDEESSNQGQENTIVVINGQEEKAGKENITEESGEKTVVVKVDSEVINNKIKEVINDQNQATGEEQEENIIEVPILTQDAKKVTTTLTGDIVKKMDENDFNLSITSNDINYVIPAKEVGIENIAQNLGVSSDQLEKIEVEVKIERVDEALAKKIEESAKAKDYEIVFQPVNFEVVAKTKTNTGEEKEVTVSKFNQYVQRVMKIPESIDPSKITTGIVYNQDGTFSHIPTEVFMKDGIYYAKLNSLTNSSYSVIWNPVTVKSVENHWSKEVVNDMASRLVIKNPETFKPEENITRGEFAEYITKSLGIYRIGVAQENRFTDVEITNELKDAIEIAVEYGIITGYPDVTFRPEAKIRREEVMVIYARAMDILGLKEIDNNRIEDYRDKEEIADWAYNDVSKTVSVGIFNGKTNETINPKDTFTYAEAATAIRNLLVASGLINE